MRKANSFFAFALVVLLLSLYVALAPITSAQSTPIVYVVIGIDTENGNIDWYPGCLTNLAPNTTYYYRVTSVDASGNSVTSPASGSVPLSFITLAASFSDTTIADLAAGSPDPNTCNV